jgi:hypothetical protein
MSTSIVAVISAKKLAANRANAQRSTGPRTAAGKQKSALNALAHGLRSRLSTATLVAQDEREDFTALAQALQEELNPRTPLQHLLAERIALLTWKLRRAAAAEAKLLDDLTQPRRHNAQEQNDDATRRHQRALRRAAYDPAHPAPDAPNPQPLPTAAQTLADLASKPTTNNQNPWLTLHRYEQATQRELHKTLKQYQSLQQQHEQEQEEPQQQIELHGPNEPTAPDEQAPQRDNPSPVLASSRESPSTLSCPNEPNSPQTPIACTEGQNATLHDAFAGGRLNQGRC